MKSIFLWLFGITGFIADVFSIMGHIGVMKLTPAPDDVLTISLPSDPMFSLFVIGYGLTGVGTMFWHWLKRKAVPVPQAWIAFLFPQTAIAGFLIAVCFLSYGKPIFSLEYWLCLSKSVFVTTILSGGIYWFLAS